MAESPELWKQRYEFSVESARRVEQEHRALVQQLSRALARVSMACEGQDRELDTELEGLRAFLRMKTLSTDVLASKIDVVEERLRALEKRAQGNDPRVQEVLGTLLSQLLDGAPARELTRAVELLRKEQRGGADPLALLPRAAALYRQLLPAPHAEAAPARAEGLAGTPEKPGLLRRLFGRTGDTADSPRPAARIGPAADLPGPGPTGPDTEPQADAFEPLSDRACKALDALIDTVPAPQAEPALRRVYELAKARLARGMRWQELVPSIEEIRVLASAALERGRDEFGLFLRQMNERLAQGASALDSTRQQASLRAEHGEALSAGVQQSMQELRERASTANDLEELKSEVSRRVDDIGTLLARYRDREQRLMLDAAAAADALAGRVMELQQQAATAEARIAEERRVALTDVLTQLPNRAAWTLRLAEEHERWRRYGRALTMAVCDIDRFKSVNDAHGHAGGDAVLSAVAATLRASLRETDFVARFGGEEFVILLPETEVLDAAQALEKARSAIAGQGVRCAERTLHVTASFGVAGFGPGDDSERVFTRADAALYRAKNSGRDRIAVYSDEDGATA